MHQMFFLHKMHHAGKFLDVTLNRTFLSLPNPIALRNTMFHKRNIEPGNIKLPECGNLALYRRHNLERQHAYSMKKCTYFGKFRAIPRCNPHKQHANLDNLLNLLFPFIIIINDL